MQLTNLKLPRVLEMTPFQATLACLLKNTNDLYSGLDLGKLVGLVFIDLKKAFDTVDHDILCQKLNFYGIQQH